ncbi:accessory Sec system glycosyltransferase GtfA [Lactobacillaceae bacterium 24-114]
MTVYNVNLGIGWASSGVEYAQSYRNKLLKSLDIPAKFIFSDMILANNIEDLTKNLGFSDDQIIWFYNFFTDVKIAPSDFLLTDFEKDEQIESRSFNKEISDDGKLVNYSSDSEQLLITARLHDNDDQQTIDQVSYVSKGRLLKRDFYSYVKYATEYYSGDEQNNHVAYRKFYNTDGSVAYTQHVQGTVETFEFPDHIYYTKNDLYLKMIKQLNFQADDTIIIDRMDDGNVLINGQLLFEYHGDAKLAIVVHADHFDKNFTTQQHVLWNNFYEYQFTHTDDVDVFIVSTDVQKQMMTHQFNKYQGIKPNIVTIPVGNIDQLERPNEPRKQHSLITASRLAPEKHIDWLVKAVVQAHKKINDLTLDIYGEGGERQRLLKLIKENNAQDYIHLMGQHDLSKVYKKYSAYVAASTSEGFGLSLMEAVGSGLPMIGFNVPYGNPTFISDKKNGFLLPYEAGWQNQQKVDVLANGIVKLFAESDVDKFSEKSYKIAEHYLLNNVAKRWQELLEELKHD